MDNYDNTSNQSQSTNASGNKTFKDSSPEEIKDRVKETVAKGVAAVAGALKGFSSEAEKNDLAGSTKQAIQKAGETTRELAGTAKHEFQQTRQEVRGGGTSGAGGSMGTSDLGGSMGSSLGSGSSTLGSGSDVGSGSNVGSSTISDVPDIRKTDLAKSDDELEKV